ncbi:E3 ubiquitin-protein ligase RSL1-like [Impatiens glandulifera]|uniref:E3 ubiquitin-protein ligase RSL1-like n=1 Tax=Impatiens glandulifera TaxID=253017 RepID=UPI001FB170FA|nr:E3 ubiquitin-protein ligase RSL1-like [Impatiens glandulifera]
MIFLTICFSAAKDSMNFHEILGIGCFDQQHRSVYHHLLQLLSDFSSSLDFNTVFLGSVITGIIITSALLFRSSYTDRKRLRLLIQASEKLRDEGNLSTSEIKLIPELDAEFTRKLQLQEALWALLTSGTNSMSSYHEQAREICESSKTTCQICFEDKERQEMFINKRCPHSFCYDCTSKHIVSKVQANKRKIPCPQINCKATLDSNTCRRIIPKEILIMWDDSLCMSLFSESETVYCPFRDCSMFLVNDSGQVITKINCPACRRLFCASCRVPWHPEFSCSEYKRLNARKSGKEDEMARELARKKNWKQCPKCKYYVDKYEGCLHITCRCGYEFCYKCGAKWSKHSTCQ